MGILEAILLGIIQGIAEFLPISSSGHLAIFQKLFGMDQVGISFDVFLHIGTLIAVFIVFWKDILRLFVDGVGIIGYLGKELVSNASDTLIIPGICLLVTAVLLFISDQMPDGQKTPKNTSYFNAVFMGICQGIATLPGLSRSGTTIVAGLLCGLRRDFVVKYSFIMSIPAILGAAVLEIPDMGKDMATTGVASYVVGMIVAAVVGLVAIIASFVIK